MCHPKATNRAPVERKTVDFPLLKMKNKMTKSTGRHVRFSPVVSSNSNTCPHPLRFEELKDLWYQKSDFTRFALRAREILASSRQQQEQQCPDDLDLVNEDVVMRGFEQYSIERQNHKYLTVLLILTSYYSGMGPDETALVARRCTKWSEQVAFLQACHDYCEVYHPSMAKLIPEVPQFRPIFPVVSMKRKDTDNSLCQNQQQRRVRRKVTHVG